MKKRFISGILSFFLLWTCLIPSGSAVPSEGVGVLPFEDVPETGELHDAVSWAVEHSVTNGKTETLFAPGDTCTRAQIITFLWRYSGQTEQETDNPFPYLDLNPDTTYGKAARWAAAEGLLGKQAVQAKGLNFLGGTPCRRKEVALYLWRLAGSPYADPMSVSFEDVEPYAEYAVAVAWAVEAGITKGRTESTFAPEDTCTRGQIVMFLRRFANSASVEALA